MVTAPPLLDVGSVWSYLVARGTVPPGSDGPVRDVSDGNMNCVFVAERTDDLPGGPRSVALKQAPPYVRALGPSVPMDAGRAVLEARALSAFARLAPEQSMTVLDVDEVACAFTMEDLSDLRVLRGALDDGAPATAVAAELGAFVGSVTAATSLLGLDVTARAELAAASANPELCRITEVYLLGQPFVEHEHNAHHPSLEEAAAQLRADPDVATAIAGVRASFATSAQALVHGDLHTGSVMVGRRDGADVVRVIDPEFSFVGPIGLDVGLVLANLLLAATRARALGDAALTAERADALGAFWDAFTAAWRGRWEERADPQLTRGWLEGHLDAVWRDALGFAAAELVRRTIGYSRSSDLETLPAAGADDAAVVRAQRDALAAGRTLLLRPQDVPDPVALAALVGAAPSAPVAPSASATVGAR